MSCMCILCMPAMEVGAGGRGGGVMRCVQAIYACVNCEVSCVLKA